MSTIDEHATVSEPSDDRQTGTAPAPRMAAGNAPEVSSGRGQEATTTRDPLETATSSLPETATGNTPPAASGSGQGTTSGDPAEATTSSAPETTTSNAPEAATTLTEPAHVDLVIGGDEEHDSTYGGSEGSGMSASLASTVFDYVYENGRRYHRFREGAYALPNDEQEQERLDMLHHIFRLILKGALHTSPLSSPRNVLDVGTGTGIWALDFADEHPTTDVLGTDLSPIQPTWTAPNCRFMVDDAESEWAYPPSKPFDFIHQRNMVGSIADWERLFRQAYDNLSPGGWYEAQEFEVWFHTQGSPLPEDNPVFEWARLLDDASQTFGKRLNCIPEMKEAFEKVGWVDIAHDIYKVPIGKWPKAREAKELGMYLQAQMFDSVEGVSMAYFTRVLNWSREQTLVFASQVRKEFADDRKHLYVYCHFLRGRKPGNEAEATS